MKKTIICEMQEKKYNKFAKMIQDDIIKELKKYAIEFSKIEYNNDFNIEIEINNRLKKSVANFRYFTNLYLDYNIDYGHKIQIQGNFFNACLLDREKGYKNLLAVLRHELIHYNLYKLKKQFKDGQKDFEIELMKNDAPSNFDNEYLLNNFNIKNNADKVIYEVNKLVKNDINYNIDNINKKAINNKYVEIVRIEYI